MLKRNHVGNWELKYNILGYVFKIGRDRGQCHMNTVKIFNKKFTIPHFSYKKSLGLVYYNEKTRKNRYFEIKKLENV